MNNVSRLQRLLLALALVATSLSQRAMAQEQRPEIQVDDASRDRSGDEPYDTPELWGSKPHQLGSGERLPSLVGEYTVQSGTVFQRISLFDNNVASLHVRGLGAPLQRRIVLTPEAVDTLKALIKRIDPVSIRAAEARMHERGADYAELRFRQDGVTHVIVCGSREVVSQQVEAVRTMLGDLLTLIAEDRQVNNPVSTHVPALGDIFMGEDQIEYRITRIVGDGTLVELESVKQPLHLYVPANVLYRMFVSVRESTVR
jgi:hypothetical protein